LKIALFAPQVFLENICGVFICSDARLKNRARGGDHATLLNDSYKNVINP
jgi:hypothetical protein